MMEIKHFENLMELLIERLHFSRSLQLLLAVILLPHHECTISMHCDIFVMMLVL